MRSVSSSRLALSSFGALPLRVGRLGVTKGTEADESKEREERRKALQTGVVPLFIGWLVGCTLICYIHKHEPQTKEEHKAGGGDDGDGWLMRAGTSSAVTL